jgi:hypothetical protein
VERKIGKTRHVERLERLHAYWERIFREKGGPFFSGTHFLSGIQAAIECLKGNEDPGIPEERRDRVSREGDPKLDG